MQKVFFWTSENMSWVENDSVNLVVTSPPYWQLKDYWNEKQIWFDDDYYEYINRLSNVWSECMRVLEPGWRLVINIWDQFTRALIYWRYKVVPIHADIICSCEKLWFDFMGQIIRQKVTSMNSTWWASVMWSFPYPRNWIIKLDFEYIMIFKKLWKPKPIDIEKKKKSEMTKEERNEYFVWHWNFRGAKQWEWHIAVYPDELPKRIIKMFSFVWDTVLDPFLGSWTTLKVARELWRNWIWFEINKDFMPIIKNKIEWEWLFDNDDVVYLDWEKEKIYENKKVIKLSKNYNLSKNIDPRKVKFWNKITISDFKENNKL